jgi:hypothetical protein
MPTVGASILASRRPECSQADLILTVKRAALALGALGRESRRGPGAESGPRLVAEDPAARQTLAQIAYAVSRKVRVLSSRLAASWLTTTLQP